MSRSHDNAARVLDEPPAETPIFVGDGCEVFEGWEGLLPEQIAECERAEAELVSLVR